MIGTSQIKSVKYMIRKSLRFLESVEIFVRKSDEYCVFLQYFLALVSKQSGYLSGLEPGPTYAS